MIALLWKPFTSDAIKPKWIKAKKKPEKIDGKVKITAFKNGWCPAMNMTLERAKRVSMEIGEKTVFEEIDTFEKSTIDHWGISDALYIDDKQINTGPPPSLEKIRKKILKKVKKIRV
jgi:hypothetical protein